MTEKTKRRPTIGDLRAPVVELTESEAEAVAGGRGVITLKGMQKASDGSQASRHMIKGHPAGHARAGVLVNPPRGD
jgi:hypothetical protein